MLIEDLMDYAVFRKELIAGRVDKVAIQRIAEHLGTIHHASHVSNMDAVGFQALTERYK